MLTRKYLIVDENGELYDYDIDKIVDRMVRTGQLRRALRDDWNDFRHTLDVIVDRVIDAKIEGRIKKADTNTEKLELIRKILEEDENERE